MANEPALRTEGQLGALAINDLVNQVTLVQNVMSRVMKQNEHYGIIPGTDKPSLLKPGAEKLAFTFRLQPDFTILDSSRSDHFISYTIKCVLTQIDTGKVWGSGIGSCNSREAKYRYRSTDTGRQVPKEYWDTRDPVLLGGPQFKPRKKDGRWMIYEQIEHDNPWDYDNTLLKMAEKRALVAATLVATAASDIFTQDVEDLRDNGVIDAEYQEAPRDQPAQGQPPQQERQQGSPPKASATKPASDAQKRMLFGLASKFPDGKAAMEELMKKYPDMKSLFASKIIERLKANDDSDLEPFRPKLSNDEPPPPTDDDLPF